MEATQRTLEATVNAIAALNLDCIKFKMMDSKEGLGLTRAQADHCEQEYKRFLTMLAKFPEEAIVPVESVDKFWHAHILDTQKYAQDCDQVFGYFLHHFPYFGMRGAEDAANFAQAVETTRRLYEAEFGAAHDQAPSLAIEASSYCARAENSSYCAAIEASSYCARVANSSYCAAIEASSYCARAANSSYSSAQVNAGVRPTLEPA